MIQFPPILQIPLFNQPVTRLYLFLQLFLSASMSDQSTVDQLPVTKASGNQIKSRLNSLYDQSWYIITKIIVILMDLILMGAEVTKTEFARSLFFNILSYFVQILFVLECILFIYESPKDFYTKSWIVLNVLVTVITIIPISIWGAYGDIVRALRVVRIGRLFSHVEGFIHLLTVVGNSISGVSWSGVFLVTVIYCYAVEGTLLFHESFDEYFGTLWRSVYTLFQIITYESWSMGIARPVCAVYPMTWIYFVSYIIITAIIMMNVVQGMIVNTIMEQESKRKDEKERQKKEMDKRKKIEDEKENRYKLRRSIEMNNLIITPNHSKAILERSVSKKGISSVPEVNPVTTSDVVNEVEMKELNVKDLDVLLEKIDEILATVKYLKELYQTNQKASEESVVAANNSPKDQQGSTMM